MSDDLKDTLIQKIAKALCNKSRGDPNALDRYGVPLWKQYIEEAKELLPCEISDTWHTEVLEILKEQYKTYVFNSETNEYGESEVWILGAEKLKRLIETALLWKLREIPDADRIKTAILDTITKSPPGETSMIPSERNALAKDILEAIEPFLKREYGRRPIESAPKGIPVIVAGGLAMQKTGGKWFTGMEGSRYERPLQWQPKWWMPIPTDNE